MSDSSLHNQFASAAVYTTGGHTSTLRWSPPQAFGTHERRASVQSYKLDPSLVNRALDLFPEEGTHVSGCISSGIA